MRLLPSSLLHFRAFPQRRLLPSASAGSDLTMDPQVEEHAKSILEKDSKVVPEFTRNKLLQETARNWDL